MCVCVRGSGGGGGAKEGGGGIEIFLNHRVERLNQIQSANKKRCFPNMIRPI